MSRRRRRAPEISATLPMRHVDGRALRLHVHVGLVDGSPGEPQAVLLVEDVTEQVEAKARIEDDLRRMELALRGSRDGIWDWDVVTGESHFSDQMYRLLGYEPQAFPGTYEEWISRIHPDDRRTVAAAVGRHLDEDLPAYRLEYRMQTKDGSYRWFQSRGEAQWDDSGRPVRIAGSFTDITEAKEFEQALEVTRAFTLAVLGSLSAQIAVIDPTGVIVAVNSAWSKHERARQLRLGPVGHRDQLLRSLPGVVRGRRQYLGARARRHQGRARRPARGSSAWSIAAPRTRRGAGS